MTLIGIVTLAVVVNTVLFLAMPVLSRRDIFFAVTVSPDFRDELVARSTLLRYRTIVLIGSITALGAMLALSSVAPRTLVLASFVQIVASMTAWVWAHRAIRPYAAAPSAVRVATLTPRDLTYPGGALTIIGPYLILGAAAIFIYANWDVIPDRIPTHWNASGVPDRWRDKSVSSVFGVIPFGLAIIAGMQLQTWFVLRRTRQIAADGASADAEWRFKRRTAQQGVVASFFMATLAGYFGTRSVTATDDHLGWGIWVILGAIMAFSLGFMAWYVFVGQGGQRRVPRAASGAIRGDASPDRAWKAGILYFNPDDPAIFVEKRMGLGWTPNLGNKWAWLFMIAALGVPLLVVLLMR